MIIQELILENFRGYKEIKIPLHDRFNLIIGDNGSGKTAILEALTVAMGSLFLGIRDTDSRHILSKDIHINTFEDSEEFGWPVSVSAKGIVNNKEISWKRELTSFKSKTLARGAMPIKKIGSEYDQSIRNNEKIILPVLAYYATGRLFDEARDVKEKESKNPQIASRLRAYNQCLKAKMTFKQFIKWFRGKELAKIQKGTSDINYSVVKNAIISNIPDCSNIYFEFDPDKPKGLKVVFNDGRILPFSYLSDGTRNFFALIADIAYKCVTLNPHLKENALIEASGIVLIDELDLHLHPDWQRKIIVGLKTTFPKVQFITSTHSPFLIQETESNQLIKLKNNSIISISQANNLSIEDIAEEFQEVENPQWSKSRQYMFEVASKYYKAVKEGKDTPQMKNELDMAMKPFAQDTALYAVIEQEKIKAEYKQSQNKNETRK
ncbi:AAA family ATPase [Halosquirtibacter laminarini]|uniref:AAA family ATPase n=1 Tax=Halosquirtibacter laminarini TaxID=3374600 RepID=A0AC61NJG2_9BACT|nr:AAA family ATPase [Prolixibacteraceae bacterium]